MWYAADWICPLSTECCAGKYNETTSDGKAVRGSSRVLRLIDGMTDPHFQVERYGHLASMGSVRYVDTCGGFPPETLHCVLRLLGVTDLPVHLRGYIEALGAGRNPRPAR